MLITFFVLYYFVCRLLVAFVVYSLSVGAGYTNSVVVNSSEETSSSDNEGKNWTKNRGILNGIEMNIHDFRVVSMQNEQS